MDVENIGMRIKKCRRSTHLTQEKLAELLDLSPHYIYEIERGSKTISLNVLEKLSKILNISTDYIIFGEEFTYNSQPIGPLPDRLSQIIENLSPDKRNCLADILSTLLPYLK